MRTIHQITDERPDTVAHHLRQFRGTSETPAPVTVHFIKGCCFVVDGELFVQTSALLGLRVAQHFPAKIRRWAERPDDTASRLAWLTASLGYKVQGKGA